jgi:hypothetical protein
MWPKRGSKNVNAMLFGYLVYCLLLLLLIVVMLWYVYLGWSCMCVAMVCSEICRCSGGADLCFAGGDVGYDVPTSYV